MKGGIRRRSASPPTLCSLVTGSAGYALPVPGSPMARDHTKLMRDGRWIRPTVKAWEMGVGATVVG